MSNPIIELKRLLSNDDSGGVRIGTVLTVRAAGTTLLEDDAGRQFTAVGTGVSVGNFAYVQNGNVIGESPALPTESYYV
jgi:hypothetical protein